MKGKPTQHRATLLSEDSSCSSHGEVGGPEGVFQCFPQYSVLCTVSKRKTPHVGPLPCSSDLHWTSPLTSLLKQLYMEFKFKHYHELNLNY